MLLLTIGLAACGGGGSDGGVGGTPPIGLHDATPYSTAAGASLESADESTVTTAHTVMVGGVAIAYTATAGHLTARAPVTSAAEASMFYVAYTVPTRAGPNRPIFYFYNGGPGSATVWLHLGSFAPRRIVTNDPLLSIPQPFQLVDNAESLIDVADLVFVDAIGTGYSEALAPATNQSFWSVDADAALMRDFIARYAALNQRQASPTFLFGESYGTTRSAVLAHLMVAAGMRLDGVVLQSSILDYNSNCGVFFAGTLSCEGFLPSYGMVGAWFARTNPVPADADAYADQLRIFATTSYGPAATAWVLSRTQPPASLLTQLVDLTGAPLPLWTANVDLDPTTFRGHLLGGQLLGVYDARVVAANGTALANSGDPSSALIGGPFAAAAQSLFANELQYVASAPYTLLSNAIDTWDYSHDGRLLPDTIPDLLAALTQQPTLRVLSLAGYHDLTTPFRQTELDVGRLGTQPRLAMHAYPGGHMTYLDDGSRPRIKADVSAFLVASGAAASARSAQARSAAASADSAMSSSQTGADRKSAPAIVAAPANESIDRGALVEGPYLPPALRIAPSAPSPRGDALRALVERKIAARIADPYR